MSSTDPSTTTDPGDFITRSDGPVRCEIADEVATITLDRPDARNALSREVLDLLPRVVAACETDDDVAVLILTGADPAFCAGLDLKELGQDTSSLATGGPDSGPPPSPIPAATVASPTTTAPEGDPDRHPGPLPPHSKPVIGAVNGVAITGGFELALACDFLIASEQARFADTHARVGIQPGWGLTVLLPEAIGLRRARQMSATGNFIDAPTALDWGLVNQVVPHDELLVTCRGLAADIVSNDQAAVRRILATYAKGAEGTTAEAWKVESAAARAWQAGGSVDPSEIERRRADILSRGRSQLS